MNRLTVAVIAITIAANAPALNLITDGGFELGDVYVGQFDGGSSPWSTQYGYATNNTFSGPNSIWNEGFMRVMDGDLAANNVTTGHTSWDPIIRNEGRSFLAVNGSTASTTPFVLEQTFLYSGTGPLVVSFDTVNVYNPDSGGSLITAYLDGNLVGTITTTAFSWTSNALGSFAVANTGSHILRIEAVSNHQSGNDFGIDNIQVNAVPEPFTMGLGLAAAGAFVRRRMKRVASPL